MDDKNDDDVDYDDDRRSKKQKIDHVDSNIQEIFCKMVEKINLRPFGLIDIRDKIFPLGCYPKDKLCDTLMQLINVTKLE